MSSQQQQQPEGGGVGKEESKENGQQAGNSGDAKIVAGVGDAEAEAKAKAAKIKEENDNAISLGGPIKKKKQINSFYDPPLPRPDEKFDPDVKRLNELVRRWKVHIFQLEVVNMTKEPIDCFMQIIIGGNYFIEIKKISGGNLQYIPMGERGIVYQTDLLKLVEPNENGRFFQTEIISEYRASYFDLMQHRLHLELWTSQGGLYLNKFLGYASIPLIEIANGSFKQGVQIMPVGEDTSQRQQAAVTFTIYFEEIWDFYLTFMDWKTTSLEKERDKQQEFNPSVELRLISPNAISDTVQSSAVKNTKLPHWALIEEGIKYRGTYTDLRHEKLQINLWNNHGLGRTPIGTKTIPLKSCLEINFVKTEMVIHKPRNREEMSLKTKANICGIQGTLRIGKKPQFAQFGDMDIIAKQEHYLAVQIQRLAVFDALDEAGGDVTVFATVDWSGTQKRTRGVRRPNVNETLMFHMPIEEEFKLGDPAKLAEFINDELTTKSEILINVWADTGKSNLENLGSSKVCLREIHFQKFEDKVFTDDRTKQKISFQCRVFTTTTKLQSAFFDTANAQVTLSIWFQPEVPYPGVDLGKLLPKEEDTYPSDLKENIKNATYQSRFNQALARNFPPEYQIEDRRFDHLFYSDQYRQKHMLPLFLSRLTPPDSNVINVVNHTYRDYENGVDVQEKMASRGIRTLSEVAHFVKCIPFRGNQEYQVDRVWSSPDFILTMRLGTIEEHAILMASMFRAVKYESIADVPLQSDSTKKNIRKGQKHEDNSTQEDRVFVCLGRARQTGAPHAWVMTLNRTFDTVTFWEPTSGQQFSLSGRIEEEEVQKLKEYLSPQTLTQDQLKEMANHIELKRQESKSLLDELEGTEMEFDSNDANSLDPQSKVKNQKRSNFYAGNHQGNLDYEDENNESDDDDDQGSDFMQGIEKVVYYEDLDQKYKGGNNINYIGKIKGLSKEKQDHLKDLDYFSDEEDEVNIMPSNQMGALGARRGVNNQKANKKPNKFLEKQEKDRIENEAKKSDKHLYPREDFYDFLTGKKVKADPHQLPFSHLDLIFNHKNVWANLQNHHPACILYHLHNNRLWLPLIADPSIPNSLLSGLSKHFHDKLLSAVAKSGNLNENQIPSTSLIEARSQGHYLKPFVSFYDPKGMEPPMNASQVAKQEAYILREVEIAIKQVRSSKNLSTKLHKNTQASNALRLQLDFMEDRDCSRFGTQEEQKGAREYVENELIKIVPENYMIAVLPSFFNYVDAERIRTLIVDNAQDFLLNRSTKGKGQQPNNNTKKIKFAIGVKIYPFHNNICSVRVALARMTPMDARSIQKQNNQISAIASQTTQPNIQQKQQNTGSK